MTVIFIVLGVLLLIIGGYFGVKFLIQSDFFQGEVVDKLGIPSKIEPVKEFIDACVVDTTERGIELMSFGGGKITFEEELIPLTPFSPLGKSLEIVSRSDFRTAVWFRETGNGITENIMPTESDMEKELAEYVREEFPYCLNNLSMFARDGYEMYVVEDELSAKASISGGTVNVEVNYPIYVGVGDVEFTLEDHEATVESQLGNMYEIAKEMFENENEKFLLEKKTLDILIAYDPEIPYAGLDRSCTPRVWSKIEAIQNVKNALVDNVAAIRIDGAEYDLQDEKYEFMELDLLDSNYDVGINLMYSSSWPTVVEISPSEGDLLKGGSLSEGGAWYAQMVSAFTGCISTHHFVYDLKYPVLITINDGDESFQFATEVIVDNNQPRINRAEPELEESFNSPVCDYMESPLDISVYTYNGQGNTVPLSGVDLAFKCGTTVCNVRDVDESGIVNVPACFNGFVVGNKEGYFEGKQMVNSKPNKISEASIVLEPLYTKDVELVVIDSDDGESRGPYDSEEVMFQFVHLTKDYSTFYHYPESTSVELIPGEYRVRSQIFADSTWPITTQKENIVQCFDSTQASLLGIVGLDTSKKCITVEIPSMEMDYAMKGGDTFEFNFYRMGLASTGSMKLFVMADKVPSNMEEMATIGSNPELNVASAYFKYPEL